MARAELMWRGHPVAEAVGGRVYADTGSLVSEWKDRPCGHCKRPNREDDHDACLGDLGRGVMNACCGHGDLTWAYIQLAPLPPRSVANADEKT
jgi:hypothetical protein